MCVDVEAYVASPTGMGKAANVCSPLLPMDGGRDACMRLDVGEYPEPPIRGRKYTFLCVVVKSVRESLRWGAARTNVYFGCGKVFMAPYAMEEECACLCEGVEAFVTPPGGEGEDACDCVDVEAFVAPSTVGEEAATMCVDVEVFAAPPHDGCLTVNVKKMLWLPRRMGERNRELYGCESSCGFPRGRRRGQMCVSGCGKRSRLPPLGGNGRMCACGCGSVRCYPWRGREGTHVCVWIWKRSWLPPRGGGGRRCMC